MRVELLGGFRVSVGTRMIGEDAWRLKKAASLIKLLAMANGHRLHRERVMDLLWPDLTSSAAANNLRQTLYAARKTLATVSDSASQYLQLRNEILFLCPDDELWVDVADFEAEAALARRSRDLPAYRRALDLYSGDLLPADLYEVWAEERRGDLRRYYLSLLTELARLHEQRGEHDTAVQALRRAVAEQPTFEEAHTALMRAYAAQGYRKQASDQYARLRKILADELGTEPGEATQRLHERIQTGQPLEEVPAVVRDPFANVVPQPRALHNVPTPRTSLVGREDQRSEVGRLLSWTRLLTLTGAGGTGKTRLATAIAADQASSYSDGAWFVELAPLANGDLALREVARVFGIPEVPGHPLSASLKEALGDKNALLILDNCEHLVEAAAELAETLLDSCPSLHILVTSREPLNVEGEQVWRVPPLPAPPIDSQQEIAALARFEAVRLFEERARSRDSAFALDRSNARAVAEVCHQLDGIPLAIELAAAKVGALSVEQISSRLRDAPGLLTSGRRTAEPRQQTLRGALDWSYDLLEETERFLFERLSVFRGGWTLEAAEAVGSGAELGEQEVLETLLSLSDKSLVAVEADGGDVRYRMLEPIRQYARDRLKVRGVEDAYERHAKYYLAIAEQPESELRGERQVVWLARLEREYANVKVALSWALDREPGFHLDGREELGLRLAVALARRGVWNAFGLGEGRMWLDRGLASDTAIPDPLRAAALREAGWIAVYQGDFPQAVAMLGESMELFGALGDKPGLAASLVYLGHLTMHGGDNERFHEIGKQATALQEEVKGHPVEASLLFISAASALTDGDPTRAEELGNESLAMNRELGDLRNIGMCLTFLGVCAIEKGDTDLATTLYEEDMLMLRGLRDVTGVVFGLSGVAGVAALKSEPVHAARLWGAAEALRGSVNQPLSPFDRRHPDYEKLLDTARKELDDEQAWEAALAEGRSMSPEQALEYALEGEKALPATLQPGRQPTSAEIPDRDGTGESITSREREVAILAAREMSNRQIAKELIISERTVSTHMHRILNKLGLHSRTQLAEWMREHTPSQ